MGLPLYELTYWSGFILVKGTVRMYRRLIRVADYAMRIRQTEYKGQAGTVNNDLNSGYYR